MPASILSATIVRAITETNGQVTLSLSDVPSTATEMTIVVSGVEGYEAASVTTQVVAFATVDLEIALTQLEDSPPDTTITGGPSGTITENSATFTYTGSDDITPPASLVYATYMQGHDSGWSSFSSATTRSYSNLPNGSYTFQVKARDQAGSEDSSPATRSFTVNYTAPNNPPDTTITGGPSGTITENSATFTYTGSDDITPPASLVYATYMQGHDSGWSSFSSATTRSYSNLPNGSYTFQVKARDQAGSEDSSPATRSFTVNYTAPNNPPDTTITGGPSGTITENSATFTYTGSDDITPPASLVYATYMQGHDSGWSSFSSATTRSYSNLPNGSYTFQVKARDQAGSEDSSPATRSFTVNYTAPLVFDFDTDNQGWRRAGFYDDGSLDQIAGYFTNVLVGWTNGIIYIGSSNLTLPPSPSGGEYIHWDFNSPDLSNDVLWNEASSFSYEISGESMTDYSGDEIYVQTVLHVRKPDLTESYFTDGQFHPIALGSNAGWTTHNLSISSFLMPVGTVILNINFRIFFRPSSSIGGHIMLDNVIPN